MPYALLEFPFSVVQRADVTRLKPSRDTMEVESMLCIQENVRIGKIATNERTKSLTLQIPHAALHSSLVAET